MPDFDLYRELAVHPTAPRETIDASWRMLLKRRRPLADAGSVAAREQIRRLDLAHKWLTDAALRAAYDRERTSSASARASRRPDRPPRAPLVTDDLDHEPVEPERFAPETAVRERYAAKAVQPEEYVRHPVEPEDSAEKPLMPERSAREHFTLRREDDRGAYDDASPRSRGRRKLRVVVALLLLAVSAGAVAVVLDVVPRRHLPGLVRTWVGADASPAASAAPPSRRPSSATPASVEARAEALALLALLPDQVQGLRLQGEALTGDKLAGTVGTEDLLRQLDRTPADLAGAYKGTAAKEQTFLTISAFRVRDSPSIAVAAAFIAEADDLSWSLVRRAGRSVWISEATSPGAPVAYVWATESELLVVVSDDSDVAVAAIGAVKDGSGA